MGKEILTVISKLKKNFFTAIKVLFKKKDGYDEKVLVSQKIYCGEKNSHIMPSHIMLPKTSTCIKSYDGRTKLMRFLIEDDDLLEK